MMPSTGPPLPPDLDKLTVAQLRILCKERGITGYSRLTKAALLERLSKTTSPAVAPPDATPRVIVFPSAPPRQDEVQNSAYIEPSADCREGHAATGVAPHAQGAQAAGRPLTELAETPTTGTSLHAQGPRSPQRNTITNTEETCTKRPAHTDTSVPSKRVRTSLQPAAKPVVHASVCQETTSIDSSVNNVRPMAPKLPTLPVTFTLQGNLPGDASVFKVPQLPVQRPRSSEGSDSTQTKAPPATVVSRPATGVARFKPLVSSMLKSVCGPDRVTEQMSQASAVFLTSVDSTLVYTAHTSPPPVFFHISFPPNASERKGVHRWAIILSALCPTDRQACMLVSRTFRYAVYLSAAHILSKNFAGRRWDTILQQHPRNMTDFWPYLRLRMAEVSQRRLAFKQSFLGRYTEALRYDPLSARLWTSPDDEKQVDIALRFVLTRMWFAISVGLYGHDASAWSKSVVRDIRKVVEGSVWQVIAQDVGTGEMCGFYVLEATCEVIGRSGLSPPPVEHTLGYALRADWATWISQQSQVLLEAGPRSLLDCVTWSNTEDYHRGISKAWLGRNEGENAESVAKKAVAEKYILASVVANGISGRWMTANAMAQEFAGLPGGQSNPDPRITGRFTNKVNMYLAAHHHVESIHFATSKGEALHAAVAVVQTPGREYYVLRDNGMQVGCEEEGIPVVWQQILSCNMVGRARE